MKNLIGDESGKVLQKRIVKDKTKRLQDWKNNEKTDKLFFKLKSYYNLLNGWTDKEVL